MTDIKLSELPEILKSDLSSDDLVLVSRAGQWSKTIAVGEFLDLSVDNLSTGILPVERGGAGSDLSLTGGTKHFIKQLAVGAGLTSGIITSSELPTNLNLISSIGGTSSLSVGTSSNNLFIGNGNADVLILASKQTSINSQSLAINSDLTMTGGQISIIPANQSDVLVGNNNSNLLINANNTNISSKNVNITGNISGTGNFNIIGNIAGTSTIVNFNSPNITLGGSNSALSLIGTITTNLNTNSILITNNNKQISVLSGSNSCLVGYGTNQNLTQYNVNDVINLIGTNSLNATANVNILNNGTIAGTRKNINFVPSGMTISCVDDSLNNRININMVSSSSDNTASKIYLWSNYR